MDGATASRGARALVRVTGPHWVPPRAPHGVPSDVPGARRLDPGWWAPHAGTRRLTVARVTARLRDAPVTVLAAFAEGEVEGRGQGRPTPSRKEGMTVDPASARRIERAGETLSRVRDEVARAVVGQRAMVDRLLIGLLTGGHVLLEGVPGLAKTLAVSSLAKALSLRFRRIQFTPDLLPADLTGTLIYNPKDGTFSAKKGPLFANIVLADEVNRAPAKVQSALLEAMQERQVTLEIGRAHV